MLTHPLVPPDTVHSDTPLCPVPRRPVLASHLRQCGGPRHQLRRPRAAPPRPSAPAALGGLRRPPPATAPATPARAPGEQIDSGVNPQIRVGFADMSLSRRLKARFRRFLERPGSTVDLAPFEAQLPAIEARGEELASLEDDELTALAREATDPVEICAIGREAADRALGERPYDEQVPGVLALLAGHVAAM